MVGTSVAMRRGSTDAWIIGNVGVLPEYRRRGIARKIVKAIINLIDERGGRRAGFKRRYEICLMGIEL